MTITITGATGFVGQNLSAYLKEKGYTISTLSLRDPNFKLKEGSNALIHLAGKAHDTGKVADEKEYFEINTELTKRLYLQFLESDFKDFIYFSSVKAVADSVEDALTEDCRPAPKTAYGRSKLAAEEFLESQQLPTGKRLIILRPCMIHGPGNKGNLNLLYKVVQKGIPWPLTAFENKRTFLSIGNLNFIIDKILNSEIPSGVYLLADDKSLSTNTLIELIAKISGRKALFLQIPENLVRKIASVGDVLRLPLNSERLKKLTENYEVSNEKIKRELKIKELPLSAQEGLLITIESFKG